MADIVADGVPPGLVELVKAHSRATISGDIETVLGDFRPDRRGQLIGSAKLPAGVVASQLQRIEPAGDGLIAATTCYSTAGGIDTYLRARWIEIDGGWVVNDVRNLPDTPPQMADVGPAEDGADTPFWEALRNSELRIPQCDDCANWIWPHRPICPSCHSFDHTWSRVAMTGTIFSWIRTWLPFAPEFTGHLPFVTLVVELPHAGSRRLLGALLDADGVEPEIGMPVVGVVEAPASPQGWPVLRWRLA
ncbi:Zn-ribbon domain-containing OB-fold protein [Mycolicibacterium neoaurum]|uniref:Zn-ribbon domain-containing OB-fold protein n=1 Tax=Mycolicibacterium neoaurum TaxID=1795 RepID=UPI0032B1AEEC